MIRSSYKVSDMDCPSDLNLIQLKLGPLASSIDADFEQRLLWVTHSQDRHIISQQLEELNLGSRWIEDVETFEDPKATKNDGRYLKAVLILNFAFFLIEFGASFWSGSMGLAADGLDMLADALVYGLSLWALNRGLSAQKKVAKGAGYFQISLAILGLAEVLRRWLGFESVPDIYTMISVSFAALLANALSLYLLNQSKSQNTALKASMIFTSNDILINLGVIIGALGVWFWKSPWPDLVVGNLVFIIVLRGAKRILALAK